MGLSNIDSIQPDWLTHLEKKATERGISFARGDNVFRVGENVRGKIHRSELDNREKTDVIWATVTEEVETARSDETNYEVFTVLLNIRSDGGGFDLEEDTFLPVPESVLMQESRSRKDGEDYDIEIHGARNDFFDAPFSEYVNDWDILLDRASGQ